MNRLDIEGNRSTPAIHCDPEQGRVTIEGHSYPENAMGFYQPLLGWLDHYLARPDPPPLRIDVELIYFNSSSSKILLDLFDLLEAATGSGRSVQVNWIYHQQNENACECGREFQEALQKLEFTLVARSG